MSAGLSTNFRYPADYTSTDLRISSKRKRNAERHSQAGEASAPATTRRHGTAQRFPHGASEENTKSLTPKQIRRELACLSPALHVPLNPGPDRRAPSMRQRNVATLVAIMHRCMLESDWVRAGRAWGMLLHTKFGGHYLDIRQDGLYGIGAEVLLRGAANGGAREHPDGGERPERAPCAFSGEGFDDARTYYELLAIQYSYRRPRSKEADALDFYSIMFGLWVSALQDLQDRERDGLDAEDDASSNEAFSSDESGSNQGASSPDPWLRRQKCLEKVISGAEQLQQRMDEVMKPPLSPDYASLTELREQVRQWIKDLKRHRRRNKR